MEETLTVDKQGSNLKSRMAYAFGNVTFRDRKSVV